MHGMDLRYCAEWKCKQAREKAESGGDDRQEVVVPHQSNHPTGIDERRAAMPKGKRLSEEVVKKIHDLVKTGMDDKKVASTLKLNVGTVMRYRRQFGLLLRQKGGGPKSEESKGGSSPAASIPKLRASSRSSKRKSGKAAVRRATSVATESMEERIKKANEYFRLGNEIMESVRKEHAENQAMIARAGKGATEVRRHLRDRKR